VLEMSPPQNMSDWKLALCAGIVLIPPHTFIYLFSYGSHNLYYVYWLSAWLSLGRLKKVCGSLPSRTFDESAAIISIRSIPSTAKQSFPY
jgi:hypothetical protein